jgi:hypothetical protein
MNIIELDGRAFALWLTDEDSESAVFSGRVLWDGAALRLVRDRKPAFEILPEWYEGIQTVTNDEVRRILRGADFFLDLNVGDIPVGAETEESKQTGLKWPE